MWHVLAGTGGRAGAGAGAGASYLPRKVSFTTIGAAFSHLARLRLGCWTLCRAVAIGSVVCGAAGFVVSKLLDDST